MSDIDPLVIKLIAENREFNANITQSARLSEDRFKRIEAAGLRMGTSLKTGFKFAAAGALSFVGALGTDAVIGAIKSGLEYASSLGEVANQLGVTTTALQEYRYAAGQSGIEIAEIDQALAQLTRRIGEGLSGTKAQAEAFQKLGISLRDAKGQVRDTGDIIPDIAEAMKNLGSDAERSAIGTDLFGKSFQKLLPLLAGGKRGVEELRKAAHDFGGILTEEQIRNADDAADKFGKLKNALNVRIAAVVADNAKEIGALADALFKFADRAIKAANAWLEFNKATNTLNARVAYAEKYLDNRKDLSPAQRSMAKEYARNGILNKGAPVTSSYFGGLVKFRQVDPNKVNKQRNFIDDVGDQSFNSGGVVDTRNAKINPGKIEALLYAELAGPTIAQAKQIKLATIEIERQTAELSLAQAQLTGSIADRAAAEKQRIDADEKAEAIRIATDDGLDEASKEKMLKLNAQNSQLQRQLVDMDRDKAIADQKRQADEDILAAKLDTLDDERRTLEVMAEFADTRKQRLDIERKILEHQQEEERLRLDAAIAAAKLANATDEVARLEARKADLIKRQGIERSNLEKGFLSPGAQYLDDLRKKAANLNDEFENIAASGLRDLSSGLADAIVSGDSLGKVLENSAKRALAALIDLGIQLLVIKPLMESLGGGFGNGSVPAGGASPGGGGLASFFASIGKIFGFASGGYTGNLPRNQVAGVVHGGEYVMNADAVNRIGVANLAALEAGRGALRAPSGGSNGGVSTVRLVLSDDIRADMVQAAAGISLEIHKAGAEATKNAAVAEVFRQGGRPRM